MHDEETVYVHLPLLGGHSVHTALRAAAVGLLAGLNWEEIVHGLRDINAQLRIEVVPGLNESTIIDDTYNASPPSTIAALNLLADMKGRHVAVLGDMLELGSYAETGHRLVGRRRCRHRSGPHCHWPHVEMDCGGGPCRGPAPQRCAPRGRYRSSVGALHQIIAPGDYVLVKGSRALGMEQIVSDLILSFDQR